MAVSQMSKVHIYAHNSLKSKLIKHLQELEIIHIINFTESSEEGDAEKGLEVQESETARLLRRDLSDLEFAIDYLKSYDKTEGGGFLSGGGGFLSGGKLLFSPQEYQKIVEGEPYKKWHEIADECKTLSDKKAQLDSRKERLQSELSNLSLWSNLDIPIEEISDTENVAVRVGSLPKTSYPEMLSEIEKSDVDVELEIVAENQSSTYIFAIFLKEDEEAVSSILSQYGFAIASFPRSEGRISDIIEELNREIAEIESQNEELEQRSLELSVNRSKFMAIYDHLSALLAQEEVKTSFLNTNQAFMIEGWVREKDLKSLQNSIPKDWDEIDIQVVESSEDEEPPVALRNNSLIKPFQMVTNLYSTPKYRELDPTPLLAPFFAFFFGICLTDAGYGIVLSVIGTIAFLIIRKSIIGEGTKQLVALLIIGGLTTILAGILTNGFFGRPLPGPLSKLSLISPSSHPKDQTIFLAAALLLGFFQVWFGFTIKFYSSLRNKNFQSAFRVDLPWIILLPSTLILVLWFLKGNAIPSSLRMSGLAAFAICSIWIIAFSDLEGESIVARIGNGFFNWYGIAGVFGDVLSYSRLFALGLATGIIARAINTIVFGMIWGPGIVRPFMGVIVLIGGHLFNIMINSLGGFIHTARLQFVEYFTKFYEGDGEEFKPFSKSPTYTAVMELKRT